MTKIPYRRRDRYRSRGFSLLEVMVALAVLTIGIVGALGAISTCVVSSKAAESYSYAAVLAQQVAGELERMTPLEPGELSGTFDDASAGYSWEAHISQTEIDGVLSVHVTVFWQTGARQQQYRLVTCLRQREEQRAPVRTPAEGGT